jgi:DNA-binding NtrC family response regulator
LQCIAAEKFDLALIDLKMKEVGGIEVLTSLRLQAPDTGAIVLTAYGSLETAVEALRQAPTTICSSRARRVICERAFALRS